MAGVLLEKRTLELRRAVSRQYFHTDLLIEQQVALRLETQRLTAPAQLANLQDHMSSVAKPNQTSRTGQSIHRDFAPGSTLQRSENDKPKSAGNRLPLLRFQHPFNPEGID